MNSKPDEKVSITGEKPSNSVPWLKDYQFKKGQVANPNGRPKKPRLPDDVKEILATNSPALMKLACEEALAGNKRVLMKLLDKITPTLKAIEVKDTNALPTMVIITPNDKDMAAAIESLGQKHISEESIIDAQPIDRKSQGVDDCE